MNKLHTMEVLVEPGFIRNG